MQEWCDDWYEIDDFGCCLNCPDSYEGCLCYNCKCTRCYWYSPPEEYDGEKGHCDKTDKLKLKKWSNKFKGTIVDYDKPIDKKQKSLKEF